MRTIRLKGDGVDLRFKPSMDMANALAASILDDPMCLSWYDKTEDRESPAHVNECHINDDVPGFIVYAESRGGELKVVVGDNDEYIFCYRPLGDFADA